MSGKAERLQDAIGLIRDEYVEEAHAGDGAAQAPEAQREGGAGQADGTAEPGAKAVKMPPQRRRRKAAAPIAIAACLVLAIGVGVFAFSSMPATTAKDVAEDAEPGAEAVMLMETGAAGEGYADGAVAGGRVGANATALVPGTPDFGQVEGEAFVLTAGEWNDNGNWPFFMNLVNSGTVGFPVFGLDPANRVKATVTDEAGNPVRNQEVELIGADGGVLWRGVSGKDGNAYLFYRDGQAPEKVRAGGVEQYLAVPVDDPAGQQGETWTPVIGDASLTVASTPAPAAGLQVMFIVDTTGSMADEIAYLQKDFAAIAGDVGSDGVEYSVNFYRDEGDEYVTKCNGFTNDVAEVQALLNREYADGGGDTPEAVAQVLAETITGNGAWRDDCNKVAFLIFDAPPHDGTDAAIEAAVSSAAERGIRLVPVVASNADRATELFGRALAIMTDGTYVFLTDDSGVGDSHLEPIIGDYTVELLHDVIVRIIQDSR